MLSTLVATTLAIFLVYFVFVFLFTYITKMYFNSKKQAKISASDLALTSLKSSAKYQALLNQYQDIQAIKNRNHNEYIRQIDVWRSKANYFGQSRGLDIIPIIETHYLAIK